ncbi:MAG: hypothetical protein RL266_1633 [Bacteroidota bacterium]|jgi:hypothetical protein
MPFQIKSSYVIATIGLLSAVLHWQVWQKDIMGIHAWRQTQTMTVVENFAFEDMNILNPRINARGDGDGIFRMEFPLMQWCFAWSYKWFGPHLIIPRILSFLIFLGSLVGFYRLLREYLLSEWMSAIGSWCFAWSPVLFYYSVNPLPDNLALCCGIWSLAFLKRHQRNRSTTSLIGFATFLSLATAVKLPFIVFGAGYLPLFFEQMKLKGWKRSLLDAGSVLLIMLPSLGWYAWVIPQWTNVALIGGVGAEEAFDLPYAINNIWGVAHSFIPELFINYGSLVFFVAGVFAFFQTKNRVDRYRMELIVFVFVLLYYLYEVNMIGLAHDYYLFPFVPFLFLVVTAGVDTILSNSRKWFKAVGYLALIIIPITAYLRSEGRWSPMGNEGILLKHKTELRDLVSDDALVVVGNDPSSFIYLYHLGKNGWTFEQNWLTAEQLSEYVSRGARFLYSNTEFVEREISLHPFLDEAIFKKDGIVVYPLKPISVP